VPFHNFTKIVVYGGAIRLKIPQINEYCPSIKQCQAQHFGVNRYQFCPGWKIAFPTLHDLHTRRPDCFERIEDAILNSAECDR
jgi:hypothetical protein